MCNFHERLFEERKRLGFNQDEMAKSGGVAKRTYCNYESGDRSPDASFLTAISMAGADVQYMLTGNRSDALPTKVNLSIGDKAGIINMKLLLIAIRELEAALKRNRKTLDPERKARAVSVLYESLEKLEQANPSEVLDESAVDRFMEALF